MTTYRKTPKTKKDAGVYEIEGGGFYVKIRPGLSKTFGTLAEARQWKEEVKVGLRRGTHQGDTSHTLYSFFEEEWLPSLDVRKPTRERYEQSMRKHILPVLGTRKLEDIKAADLNRLMRKLSGEMKVSSAITAMGPLKSLLRYAEEEGVLKVNESRLMKRVSQKKEKKKPVKAMDEVQLRAFFEHIPAEFLLLFEVLLGTGCRISEVLGMTWDQVRGDHILVDKRWASQESNDPKNGSERSVPISRRLSELLTTARVDETGPKAGLVFPNRRGSHWNDVTLARHALEPAREGSGLRWVGFHTFRHTYVTRAYRNGVPLGDIADYVGHGDPIFTWKQYRSVLETHRANMDWQDSLSPLQYTSEPVLEAQTQAERSLLKHA